MIKIKDLSKVYQTPSQKITALDNVSLTVEKGEIFGIIGLSGAGKSTLIRCINMLEKPTTGSIVVDSQEITRLDKRELRAARQKIGMIFQHFNLLSSRTVFDNVMFPLEIAKVSRPEAVQRAQELLELVGLADKEDAYPSQLSGGQKQRVGIARALANGPKLLLSDEATSALDPQTTRSILELLREINRQLNLTILLITHDMNVIKEICDRVAVIDSSHIVEVGANFFQHIPYLDDYNAKNNANLAWAYKVHNEPMGVYSNKIDNLDKLADGAKIGIPNDATNGGRALNVLEAAGLLKLTEGAGVTATDADIVENPKNFKIQMMDAAMLPRAMADLDLCVINSNYALEGNLNPVEDAIFMEPKDSPFANVLVVRDEDKDKENIKKLGQAIQSLEVKKYIEDNYEGSVIPAF